MKKKETDKKIFISKPSILLIICILLFILLVSEFIFFQYSIKSSANNPYQLKASPRDNFIFLGDSLTAYYPLNELYDDIAVVNSGVPGYTTDDILNNIDSMVSVYNPTKVFLLIGTNDIKIGKTTEEIVDNIDKIVNNILIKRPKTKIYIESIYPINDTNDEKINHESVSNRTNEQIREINKKLKKYCKDNNYTYIDMYSELVDNEGNLSLKYTTEGIHISDLGYLKITKVLYQYIND